MLEDTVFGLAISIAIPLIAALKLLFRSCALGHHASNVFKDLDIWASFTA
jgi:hypothetical protein